MPNSHVERLALPRQKQYSYEIVNAGRRGHMKVDEQDDRNRDAPGRDGARAGADVIPVGGRGGARASSGVAPRARSLDARVSSLAAALRRARVENAEHSGAFTDVRAAEIARLEILRDALEPVLAQLPAGCDLFDAAVSRGERPRLFIDHLGFVEMAEDKRRYRFQQDTRHGRVAICENDRIETVVEAITTYIAHRLIEREKALAADYRSGGAASAFAARTAAATPQPAAPARVKAGARARLMNVFLFIVEFLGSVAFFGLVGLLIMWAWRQYAPH